MGFARRRRRAGRADRRHRSRRRHREPRRHQGRARAGGCGADRAASWSTNSAAIRRCSPPAWRGSRRRPAGRRSAWCRISRCASVARRGCAGARPHSAAGQSRTRGSASRCRSCRISPISTISIRSMPSPASNSCGCGRARPCPATPTHRAARLEGDDRRPRGVARGRLRHRHRRASAPRRQRSSVYAAATRCSGARVADPDGIEGPAGRRRGTWPARCRDGALRRQAARTGARTTSDGAPFRGYEMHMGVTDGAGLRATVRAACGRLAGRRGLGRRPGDRHLCARPVRRRPAARRVAGAFKRHGDVSPTTRSWSDARRARGPLGRAPRSRPPASPSPDEADRSRSTSAIRMASARR